MKKRKEFALITERDLELFKFLFENKVATVNQIQKHIFKNTCTTRIKIRLSKLEKFNLLEKRPVFYTKRWKLAYRPSGKTIKELQNVYPFVIDKGQYKSNSISHDVNLGAVPK